MHTLQAIAAGVKAPTNAVSESKWSSPEVCGVS